MSITFNLNIKIFGRQYFANHTVELFRTAANDIVVFNGAQANERAGDEIAGVGDVNSDSFDDFMVSSYNVWERSSRIFLVLGRPHFQPMALLSRNYTDLVELKVPSEPDAQLNYRNVFI